MTDRELALGLSGKSVSGSELAIKAFRAEVLREAAERGKKWFDLWLLTDHAQRSYDKDSNSLGSTILGDHAGKMIDCPACGRSWDISRFNACQCGASSFKMIDKKTFLGLPVFDSQTANPMLGLDPAVQDAVQKNFSQLVDPLPVDVLLEARNEKLHEDMPGRRSVKATMLEPPDASFDCPACAESVDGQPGNGACQQCKEEDTHAAKWAYDMADAMMKQREEKNGSIKT